MLSLKQALRGYRGHSPKPTSQSGRLVSALGLFALMTVAHGQAPIAVNEEVLKSVMRDADSFSLKEGNPPVYRGYKGEVGSTDAELVGYLFETPDYPPEEVGYSAPIDVLVGIDLQGTLTGIEVLHYIESYKSIRGDFINSEYFPQQFSRKNITEDFRVGRDIDGISRATITSWAVARGVRDSARKMAHSYLPDSDYVAATSGDAVALRVYEDQSWDDMIESGLVKEMLVIQPDLTELHLSLAFIGHDGLGELMLGIDDYSRADRDASNRSREGKMLLVGIDGNSSQPFRQERLAIKQGDEVYPVERRRFVYAGSADAGKIKDRTRFAGAIVLMPELDLAEPFSILYTTEGVVGEFGGIHEMAYQVPELALALSEGGPIAPELIPPSENDAERFQFPEETVWTELLDSAPLSEVFAVLFICALVMTAFVMKKEMLRWAALTVTLIYLGWMDGGFVSVSHITNGIKLGPSLFLNDLPLLIVIVFTVVTALLWGRIFCSSLCPFGALQDFITRIVPKQFRYQVPQAVHDLAIYLKYAVLAFLVLMA
ncbi:MAG: 4Fe-4S binding protein, partial [Pseudohongiellaceae bacterium]